MKPFNFKKIDAFATEKSAGNPAGYVLLNNLQEITEQEMLQIAQELKGFVNEVGYVAQTGKTEFDLRYFSSEREVDFCGHATIAIMYDIIKSDELFAHIPALTINTNRGKLTVENRVKSDDSVFIMSPSPVITNATPTSSEIAKHLSIAPTDINTNYPISIINAGLTTLIVPITKLSQILNIAPDLEALKNFCFSWGIDIIEVFSPDVALKSNNYRTRVFAPTFGYLEDPTTGSGNSAFGYYLIENNWWKKGTITIEQNGLKDNFNIVKLQIQKDNNNKKRVCFGGGAITRIEGKYVTYR